MPKQKHITFNVWLEIERYDDRSGQGHDDEDFPRKLARFDTRRKALQFADRIERLAEAINI